MLERRLVADAGPWSGLLGDDEKGYVMLFRRLDVDGKFSCSDRMYLPASRFGRLLKMAEKRLADTNLKTLLETEFAAPTLHSDGVANVVPCLPADARVLKLAPSTSGMQVQIRGYSFGRVSITYQRMFVPPTEYGLKLDFNPPSAPAGRGGCR